MDFQVMKSDAVKQIFGKKIMDILGGNQFNPKKILAFFIRNQESDSDDENDKD